MQFCLNTLDWPKVRDLLAPPALRFTSCPRLELVLSQSNRNKCLGDASVEHCLCHLLMLISTGWPHGVCVDLRWKSGCHNSLPQKWGTTPSQSCQCVNATPLPKTGRYANPRLKPICTCMARRWSPCSLYATRGRVLSFDSAHTALNCYIKCIT